MRGTTRKKVERVECTLVWRDGSTCRATVPVGEDVVKCGASWFRRDARRKKLIYREQAS